MRPAACCQFRVVIHMPCKCPWLASAWLQRLPIAPRGCRSGRSGGTAPDEDGRIRTKPSPRSRLHAHLLHPAEQRGRASSIRVRLNVRIAARIFISVITGTAGYGLMAWNLAWESKGTLESSGWILGRDLFSFLCFIDIVACDATSGRDKSRGQ